MGRSRESSLNATALPGDAGYGLYDGVPHSSPYPRTRQQLTQDPSTVLSSRRRCPLSLSLARLLHGFLGYKSPLPTHWQRAGFTPRSQYCCLAAAALSLSLARLLHGSPGYKIPLP